MKSMKEKWQKQEDEVNWNSNLVQKKKARQARKRRQKIAETERWSESEY